MEKEHHVVKCKLGFQSEKLENFLFYVARLKGYLKYFLHVFASHLQYCIFHIFSDEYSWLKLALQRSEGSAVANVGLLRKCKKRTFSGTAWHAR